MVFRIGVLGTATTLPARVDPNIVRMMLIKALGDVRQDHPYAREFVLVSRAVKTGIPGIAYELVSSREHRYGWPTWGIGVSNLRKAERFALDEWLPCASPASVAHLFSVVCDAMVLVHFGKDKMLQGIANTFKAKGGRLYECFLDDCLE